MLGDGWGNKIKGQHTDSVRFSIEQGVKNSAYIHHLNVFLHGLGYCSNLTTKLLVKSQSKDDKRLDPTVTRFNYKLTTFSFTSLLWIIDSFYHKVNGKMTKKNTNFNRRIYNTLGFSSLNHARWIQTKKSSKINCNK